MAKLIIIQLANKQIIFQRPFSRNIRQYLHIDFDTCNMFTNIILNKLIVTIKNMNSKNIREYQGSANKRSMSPLLSQPIPQHPNNSSHKSSKKKGVQNSPYHKAMKEFESYGKADRKKGLQSKPNDIKDSTNKYRIVTEPVQDRILHLGQSNIFNSSLALRNPQSRKRMQTEVRESTRQIRLNVRDNNSKSKSRDRIYSNTNNVRTQEKCRNCARFAEELDYLNSQIKKLIKQKNLWRQGQLNIDEAHEIRGKNSPSIPIKYPQKDQFKFADHILIQIRSTFHEMMKDIQALSSIDYPKMLSMNIFHHQHTYNQYVDVQEAEFKDLFSQLRASVEGKTIQYDTYDSQSENTYTKMIMRNLKSRLSGCLRENLELKIKKSILERAEEISEESEGYLRKVIEDVLETYTHKK